MVSLDHARSKFVLVGTAQKGGVRWPAMKLFDRRNSLKREVASARSMPWKPLLNLFLRYENLNDRIHESASNPNIFNRIVDDAAPLFVVNQSCSI